MWKFWETSDARHISEEIKYIKWLKEYTVRAKEENMGEREEYQGSNAVRVDTH